MNVIKKLFKRAKKFFRTQKKMREVTRFNSAYGEYRRSYRYATLMATSDMERVELDAINKSLLAELNENGKRDAAMTKCVKAATDDIEYAIKCNSEQRQA
jgi:hypothetical protein